MAQATPRWMVGGAAVFAAVYSLLPAALPSPTDPAAALLCVALIALAAVAIRACRAAGIPVAGPALVTAGRDRPRQDLVRQSNPAAAGHTRSRAPDCR